MFMFFFLYHHTAQAFILCSFFFCLKCIFNIFSIFVCLKCIFLRHSFLQGKLAVPTVLGLQHFEYIILLISFYYFCFLNEIGSRINR